MKKKKEISGLIRNRRGERNKGNEGIGKRFETQNGKWEN